jgi:hypothetical protein
VKLEHPAAMTVLHVGRLRGGGAVLTAQELCDPVQSVEIVLSAAEVLQVVEYLRGSNEPPSEPG